MTKILITPKSDEINFIMPIQITDSYPLSEDKISSILATAKEAIDIANKVMELK